MQFLKIRKKLFQNIYIIFIFIFLLTIHPAFSATYYVDGSRSNDSGDGTAWATAKKYIYSGIQLMNGGDTLIIKDGVYTSDNDRIRGVPSGTPGNYTTIRAENNFQVILEGLTAGTALAPEESIVNLYQKSWVTIEGLILKDCTGSSIYALDAIMITECDHIQIKKTGIKNGAHPGAEYAGGLGTSDSSYCLFEDIFICGMMRYGIVIGGGEDNHHNILRRVVVRWDYCTTAQPRAAITVYGGDQGTSVCNNILQQNCIVINGNEGSGMTFSGGFTVPHETSLVKRYDCISLNNAGFGFHSSEDELCHSNSNINCVAWDSGGTMWKNLRPGNDITGSYHSTFHTVGQGLVQYGGGGGIIQGINNIFYNCTEPNQDIDYQEGNNFWPADQAQGVNYTTVDPGFQYIIQSPLPGQGATILKKKGVTGTIYGEPGYNTLTDENLWPFPYEDEIRALFREENDPPGGYGLSPTVNDTKRGFCADNQTLTKYIWEYLGNTIPPEIYGATSTTYYISPAGDDANDGLTEGAAWKTFAHTFSTMSNGNELILLDGTYSDGAGTGYISWDDGSHPDCGQPPSGKNINEMTVIRAKNPGNVTVDGGSRKSLFIGRSFRKDSYIKIQGITFEGGGQLYNTGYVTVKDCGFHSDWLSGGAVFSIGCNDHDQGNDYNLIEDCWIWGQERIIAINYRASHNIWRRVVVRGDGCNSPECTGSGNPNVGFSVYDSSSNSIQNMIIIDRTLGGGSSYSDFASAQHTPGDYLLGPNEWIGCISLNSADQGYYFEADEANNNTHTLRNCVAWDSAGDNVNIGGPRAYNVFLENITTGVAGFDNFRVAPEVSGGTVQNVIAYQSGRYGVNSVVEPAFCNVYGSGDSSYNQTTCSTGCLALDPLSGGTPSLKHLVRIEEGSSLKGTGMNGADYGANILKKYGNSGTRYGETYYNNLTTDDLWPWPNEDRIRAEMSQDSTRGFCSNGMTLTKYIWEYLGNPIPPEIYGGGSPLNITTTSLNNGTVGVSYSQTLSASGGTLPYTWSIDSGSLPGGLSLNSSTGEISGEPAANGVFNFTVLVTDDDTNTDTQPLSITINASGPNTYYISTTGSDTNNGSIIFPWATLQHAADTVQPGDTVLVNNGNYAGFRLSTSGTSNSYITFKALNNNAVINSGGSEGDRVYLENVSYVIIQGFQVQGASDTGVAAHDASANNPMKGVIIRSNKCTGCQVIGIYLSHGRGSTIEYNTIIGSVTSHGIYLANAGSDNTIIRGNIILSNAVAGIHCNGDLSVGGDGLISGIIIEGNIISGNGQNGLNMDGVQDSLVYNNIIYGNARHAVRAYAQDGAEGPKNLTIINNHLFADSDNWPIKIADDTAGPDLGGHVILNNILLAQSGGIYTDSSNIVSDYNIFSNGLAARQAAGFDEHSLTSYYSDLFRGSDTNDYYLTETSPALDNGTNVSSYNITQDIRGISRPQWSGWDIGAYEYNGTISDTTSPVLSNIGSTNITDTAVTILWNTDENAASQVEYGLTTAYGSETTLDTTLVLFHSVLITGLDAETTYHFRIKSMDASSNLAVSGDYTFTTEAPSLTNIVISSGDIWKYFKGTADPGDSWVNLAYDDSAWLEGPTGIGYGDGDDATLLADMQGNYVTVYMRKLFTINDKENVTDLLLSIDFDDGFVAYLNGNEVTRSNISGSHDRNTPASSYHEAGIPVPYDISSFKGILNEGNNVLAVEIHNDDINSSDLSMIPELTVIRNISSSTLSAPLLLSPKHDIWTNDNQPPFDWSDVTGANQYTIQVSVDPSFSTLILDKTNISSDYTCLTPLNQGTNYWRVRVYSTNLGFGPFSTWRIIKIDTTLPSQVLLSSPSNGSFTINTTPPFIWNPSSDIHSGISNYRIEIDTETSFTAPLTYTNRIDGLSYTPLSGLDLDTYFWRVRAYDRMDNPGDFSTIYSITIISNTNRIIPDPLYPVSLVINTNRPLFFWSDESGQGAIQYWLQISDNDMFSSLLLSQSNITATNYQIGFDLSDTTNWWRIRIQTTNSWQEWSSSASFSIDSTPPDISTLKSPVSNTVTNINTPAFQWNASGGNPDHYILWIDNETGFNYPRTAEITNNSLFYTPPGSLSDGTCFWKVKVCDALGNESDWSTPWNLMIDTEKPGNFSLISPTNNTSMGNPEPEFFWMKSIDPGAGISYYQLQISSENSFSTLQIDIITNQTNYSIPTGTAMEAGLHYWRVIAYDKANNFSISSGTNILTIDTNRPFIQLIYPVSALYINEKSPVFKWKEHEKASKYHIQISANLEFTNVLHENSDVADTNYSSEPDMSNRDYYWRVRGYDLSQSLWGDWAVGTFQIDTQGPEFTLLQTEITTPPGKEVTIKWNAVSDNGVGLDKFIVIAEGEKIDMGLSTWYNVTFNLKGKYVVTIQGFDKLGNFTDRNVIINVKRILLEGQVKAYPNPVRRNKTAKFQYGYNTEKIINKVNLFVYDLSGNIILKKSYQHENGIIKWDLKTGSGHTIAPGLYIYKIVVKYSDHSKISTDYNQLVVIK